MADKVRNTVLPGLAVEYLYEEVLSGNRILQKAVSSPGDHIYVINGDTFLQIPFPELNIQISRPGIDGVILIRKKDGEYSSIIFENDIFLRRDKDPDKGQYMYAGISLFKKGLLPEFREENLFDSLERTDAVIGIVKYEDVWFDIGTPELYFSADSGYRKYKNIKNRNSLSDNVDIYSPAEINNSIIWENTRIGGNVKLSGCIVSGDISLNDCEFSNKIITSSEVYDLKI